MRAPLALAREGLRDERRPALLLLAAVACTAALAFPALALPRLGLALPWIPDAGGTLVLPSTARGPGATQARAVAELLDVLRSVGWTALGVAALTILSLYAVSSAARRRDLAIHRAVGASRRAIVATLLLEAFAVAALALAAGGAAGALVLHLALRAWPGAVAAGPGWPLGLAALLVGVVAVGRLLPIRLAAARDVPLDGDAEVSLGIPVVQFGVGMALVVTGVAFLRSAPAEGTGATAMHAPGAVLAIDAGALGTDARARLFAGLLGEARAAGAVTPSLASAGQAAGLGTIAPVTTHCGQCFRSGIFLEYEPTRATHHLVSPDSFAAHGLRLASGRAFTAADTLGAERVVVVNRDMALRHFQPGDPVGRRLWLAGGLASAPYRVIGVVDDGRPAAFGASGQPHARIYLATLQHPPRAAELLVRADDAAGLARVLAAAGAAVRRAGATGSATPETAHAAQGRAPARWFARALLVAGVLLGLVALMGLGSATWRWVGSLAPELAIRRSVGAPRGAVLRLVLVRAAGAVAQGVVAAVVILALALGPLLETLVPARELWRPDALAGAALAGLAVTIAAAAARTLGLLAAPPARHAS